MDMTPVTSQSKFDYLGFFVSTHDSWVLAGRWEWVHYSPKVICLKEFAGINHLAWLCPRFFVWLQQLQGTDILVRVTIGVRRSILGEFSAVLHSLATVLCRTKFWFTACKSLSLLSWVCADGCSTREEMANYLLSNLMACLNKTCVRNSLSQR